MMAFEGFPMTIWEIEQIRQPGREHHGRSADTVQPQPPRQIGKVAGGERVIDELGQKGRARARWPDDKERAIAELIIG